MICCVKLFINRTDRFLVIRETGIFAVLDDVHTDRCNYVEVCYYLSCNRFYAVEYPNNCCNYIPIWERQCAGTHYEAAICQAKTK